MVNRPPAVPQRPATAPAAPPAPVSGAPRRPGTGSLTPMAQGGRPRFVPQPINKIEDTGLNVRWIQDLLLKTLYYRDNLSGFQIADYIRLPFVGIVDGVLNQLKRDKLIEVPASAGGFGEGAYQYIITGAGQQRAREALERSQYVGPAPVPIHVYNDSIHKQSMGRPTVTQKQLRSLLGQMVISDKIFNRIGPAINSGTSMFMYGPPGNGKTTVARAVGNLILSEDMYIPYAIDVEGVVVKMYDSVNHQLAKDDDVDSGTGAIKSGVKRDPRWVKIKRPFIVVGGELTLAGLDLVFDDTNKYYEAPFQVKANGGMFLIDDFGRQQVRPRDLLNRWIVPLENRIDYLTLHTGRKVDVPFDVLVVFSTNLPPKDLVDEAFLRRLRHKVEIGDPNYEEFNEIFKRVADGKRVRYSQQGLAYLLQEWYIKRNRKLRAVHPRDICDQIIDISTYLNVEPAMTKELLEMAAGAYFVEL
ncbi:MAG TPA: ATP-binding protein [Anaerolineales bacterium]|nr:ATP-binding protein [Anaerolineales bacterium]